MELRIATKLQNWKNPIFPTVGKNRKKPWTCSEECDYKGGIKEEKRLWAKRVREVCIHIWKIRFKGRRGAKPHTWKWKL